MDLYYWSAFARVEFYFILITLAVWAFCFLFDSSCKESRRFNWLVTLGVFSVLTLCNFCMFLWFVFFE